MTNRKLVWAMYAIGALLLGSALADPGGGKNSQSATLAAIASSLFACGAAIEIKRKPACGA